MLTLEDGKSRRVRMIVDGLDDEFVAVVSRDGDRYMGQAVKGRAAHGTAWSSSVENAVEGLDFTDKDGKIIAIAHTVRYEFV